MRRRLAILAFIVLLVYWTALFVATHVPTGNHAQWFRHSDKIAHALAYAILAWLAAMVLRILHLPLSRICVIVLVVGATYGAVDEWLQRYTQRHSDLFDWTADLVGTICGLIVFLLTHEWVRRIYLRATRQQEGGA